MNAIPRVGIGYDVHRFKTGRRLVLGGVAINCGAGLDGHSDADVLVHSIMDAVLGAAGLRDIGFYFPNSDPQYKDASSLELLKRVVELAGQNGYIVGNIDSSIIAETPKIQPYTDEMKINISAAAGIPKACVGVKATTNEGLGAIGKKEGIASFSVCLLIQKSI